jgi:hypothetical protein
VESLAGKVLDETYWTPGDQKPKEGGGGGGAAGGGGRGGAGGAGGAGGPGGPPNKPKVEYSPHTGAAIAQGILLS